MVALFANSGDPDQMPRFAATDLGLHCLLNTILGVSRLQWVKPVNRHVLVPLAGPDLSCGPPRLYWYANRILWLFYWLRVCRLSIHYLKREFRSIILQLICIFINCPLTIVATSKMLSREQLPYYYNYSDRPTWSNSVDPDQTPQNGVWSGSNGEW